MKKIGKIGIVKEFDPCASWNITACDTDFYRTSSTSKDCTDVGKGYYSASGEIGRKECNNKPSNSSYTDSIV